MTEADERFIERLRPEIDPVVAGWASVEAIHVDRLSASVALVIALEARTGPTVIRCEGATLIEATAAIHSRLVETRLDLAFRELVQAHGR